MMTEVALYVRTHNCTTKFCETWDMMTSPAGEEIAGAKVFPKRPNRDAKNCNLVANRGKFLYLMLKKQKSPLIVLFWGVFWCAAVDRFFFFFGSLHGV